MPVKKNLKDTLCDRAIIEIRESILSLQFTPGDRLIVDRLAEMFSISRTPIREALKELVSEGLVKYDKISYKVIDLTKKDILDIFSIRKSLEILAAGETAKYCDAGIKKALIKIFEKSCTKRSKDNFLFFEVMNQKLHLSIAEYSQNPRLFNLLSSYQHFVRLVLRWTFSITLTERDMIITNTEHKAIIDAIIGNDLERAKEAMAVHLENAEKRTLSAIEQAYTIKNLSAPKEA